MRSATENEVESDSEDPELLAELRALGYYSDENADKSGAESGNHDARATVVLLKERSIMYKLAAKKCLTEKNRQQAGIYLKQSKEIAQYMEAVANGVVVWMEDIPPKLKSSLYTIKRTKPSQMQPTQVQAQAQAQEEKTQVPATNVLPPK